MRLKFDRENLPVELTTLSIKRLDLSIRSFNTLKRNGITTVGDLLELSTPELSWIRDLGTMGRKDVQRALHLLVTDYRGSHRPDNKSPRKKTHRIKMTMGERLSPAHISADLDSPVGVLDLSTRTTNTLARLGIKSVRQLMEFSQEEFSELENIGRSSVAEVHLKLPYFLSSASAAGASVGRRQERIRAKASVGTKTFVESMLDLLPDRQRKIIAYRYGLWDGIAESFQDIGDKFGLTKERTRQVVKKSLARLHRVFSHRLPSELVACKVSKYLAANQDRCGVLNRDEIIPAMADDCSEPEASLALALLNAIESSKEDLLTRCFVEPEPNIFCVSKQIASQYREILELTKSKLQKSQKPISETELSAELAADKRRLLERILSVSPSVGRLTDGKIAPVTLDGVQESKHGRAGRNPTPTVG